MWYLKCYLENKNTRKNNKKINRRCNRRKRETIELEQTPYLWGNQADDKLGIIDVRATINGKNPIDIEMQILDNHDIEKRILFYWSKLYLKQIDRGDDYNKLNRSISIIFLDYEIEKLKQLPIHTKWQIRNDKNGSQNNKNNLDRRFRDTYNRDTKDK